MGPTVRHAAVDGRQPEHAEEHVGHRRVLVVLEDSDEAERVSAQIRSIPYALEVERVRTGFQAMMALKHRPSHYCLIVIEDQAPLDTVEFMSRMRSMAPGIPVILMNRRGPGAVLVAYERGFRRSNPLPEEGVTLLWRRLQAGRPSIASVLRAQDRASR